METSPTVIVLAGGDPVSPVVAGSLPDADLVIAADSGLHQADRLGLAVDLVVGDLDSADPKRIEAAEAAGIPIERHSTDKEATDLALAMAAAIDRGARRIVVVGGSSFDRIDHFLANALLIGGPVASLADITWFVKDSRLTAVTSSVRLSGRPGEIVTILPVGGPATGVTTTGLQWQLTNDVLEPGSTRGVSNVVTGEVTVSVASGTVLVIQRRST